MSGGDIAVQISESSIHKLKGIKIISSEFEIASSSSDGQQIDHTNDGRPSKPKIKSYKNFRLEHSNATVRNSIFKKVASIKRQIKLKNSKNKI